MNRFQTRKFHSIVYYARKLPYIYGVTLSQLSRRTAESTSLRASVARLVSARHFASARHSACSLRRYHEKSGLRSKKAVSLLEILIVSVISVFIIVALTALLSSSRSTWIISGAQADLYINARKAMNEMFNELVEASSGDTETFTFIDPINGQYTQGLWFACARGSNADAGEDGSLTNNYVHLDANNAVTWRSLVVYCLYAPSPDIMQLRRYENFGTNYSNANIFPFTLLSVSTTTLNFIANDGSTVISIDRTGGRVLANYLRSEDANNNNVLDANENDGTANDPVDNQDGILNYGVNFVKNIGNVDITLFLAKDIIRLREQGMEISTTLRNKVKFRQP